MLTLLLNDRISGHGPQRDYFPTKRDWPYFPACLSVALWSLIVCFSMQQTWLVDLQCLLTSYAIAQSGFVFAQTSRKLNHPGLRWLLVCGAIVIATISGVRLQFVLWPASVMPHERWTVWIVVFLFLLVTILPSAIKTEVSRAAWEQLKRAESAHAAERQLLEARLTALQGQIEPHFLFNTLATTRALLRQDPPLAESMLQHLIAYLQEAMPDMRAKTTSVAQELKRAEAYLKIMQIRLSDRLRFSVECSDEAQACEIPPLMLMTMVENAIKHGVEPKIGMTHVKISVCCEDDFLHIIVADDGAGFQGELGNGIGLLNIQQRLDTMYGNRAELSLVSGSSGGVIASMRLPRLIDDQIEESKVE